jgi:sulfatase modifying factor 1
MTASSTVCRPRRRGSLPAGADRRRASAFNDDEEELAKYANVADGTLRDKFTTWKTIKARDGYVFTAPVGNFKENGFGLKDMHGNVWEWCSDWYAKYPTNSVTDPAGPAEGLRRVVRGGSWISESAYYRLANRNTDGPLRRRTHLGFRVARVPSSK